MDPETVVRTARLEFAGEDHLVADLAHRHVEIVNAGERVGHLVEFVVMGGEKRLGPLARLMQVLGNGPRDGNAVVGTRAAAYLVQNDQAALRDIVQDVGRLIHLDHEGRFARGQVVRRPHPGEDPVDHPETCAARRHITAHLRHQADQGRLTQQSGLTGHVRSGDHHDLLRLPVEGDAVGNVRLFGRQTPFDDRMAAVDDLDVGSLVHLGTTVLVLLGDRGHRKQAIGLGYHAGIFLNGGDVLPALLHQGGVKAGFDLGDAILGAEDLGFEFLEFGRDVPFGRDGGLLADPVGRHLVLVRITHLDVIAEHVVEPDLERGDAGAFGLLLDDAREDRLVGMQHRAQFVQLGIGPLGDHPALGQLGGRIRSQGAADRGAEFATAVHRLGHLYQQRAVARLSEDVFHRGADFERSAQGRELLRVDAPRGHLPRQALHIGHRSDVAAQFVRLFLLRKEVFHRSLPAADRLDVLEREHQPAAQHPRSHRADGAIQHIEQGGGVFTGPPHRRSTP